MRPVPRTGFASSVSTQCFALPHVKAVPTTSQLYLLPDFPSLCQVWPVSFGQTLLAEVAGVAVAARHNITATAIVNAVTILRIRFPFLSGRLQQPLERHAGSFRQASDGGGRPLELAQHDLVLADQQRAVVDDAVFEAAAHALVERMDVFVPNAGPEALCDEAVAFRL